MSGEDLARNSVAVVVVTWNGREHLAAALPALEALRGPIGERWIVDNGSEDGTGEWVREQHPRWRVLRLEENRGPAAARNAGLHAVRARRALLVDNDVVPAPDVLERLLAAAERDPDAWLLEPRSVFDEQPDRVHYDGGGFHYVGLVRLRNFYTPLAGAEGTGTVEIDCAISLCLLVDVPRVRALGGFWEDYFILFEDLDLSWRVRLAGGRILAVEDALVRHRAGTPALSFRSGPRYPARRAFLHSRNRWWFLLSAYRWRTLLLAAPGLLAYELVWFGFTLSQGHGRAYFAGKLAALGGMRRALARRRAIQPGRRLRDRELLAGGPLTITPSAAEGGVGRLVLRALEGFLRAWWALVRPLAG